MQAEEEKAPPLTAEDVARIEQWRIQDAIREIKKLLVDYTGSWKQNAICEHNKFCRLISQNFFRDFATLDWYIEHTMLPQFTRIMYRVVGGVGGGTLRQSIKDVTIIWKHKMPPKNWQVEPEKLHQMLDAGSSHLTVQYLSVRTLAGVEHQYGERVNDAKGEQQRRKLK